MDEAAIRIILQDDGGGSPAPSSTAAPSTPTSTSSSSQNVKYNMARAEAIFKNLLEFNVGGAWALQVNPDTQHLKKLMDQGRINSPKDVYNQLNPSKPIPVDVVKPPKPDPTPAAPPTDWMKSLISPAEGANPHVLLEGQSGSGKSLAAKHLAFERMKQGQDVHVIDTHNPESWGGAKQVFQGTNEQAGEAAAEFLRKSLESRKEEASAAKMRGEEPNFKPMTVVFSDFARLMKDSPQLGVEFATLLTEARKFRISIIADTTALTGAASGIKGIQDVLANFGQKVKFFAPTAQGDPRRAEVAGKTYDTPKLPDYKEKVDYGLVKPPPPPQEPPLVLEGAFDPAEQARKRREAEVKKAQVDAAYKQQYGGSEEQETKVGALLKVADSLRGTIGGTFGTVIGAVVDVVSFLNKAQVEASKVNPPAAIPQAGAPPIAAIAPPRAAGTAVPPTARPTTAPVPSGAGAAAGPTGGGMGGIAAAAGPIGMAVGVALALDQVVKGAIKGVIGGVGGLARAASSPNDDPATVIEGVSSAISGFGEKIPIIGTALVALGETGKLLAGLMQSFTKQAEKYAEYNPQIAQQLAMAEIRQVMGDMRRAQRSGGELARFVEEQSRMQQQFEEIKMKIWMKILPVITAILQLLGRLLNVLEDQNTEDFETPTDTLLRGGVQVPVL